MGSAAATRRRRVGNLLAFFVAFGALVGVSDAMAQTYEFPSAAGAPLGPSPSAGDSFQTDLFTGSASTSIPIVVPPGTGGMQPSLALVYNSGSRRDAETILAPGWNLAGLGYIERSTRFGVPTYTTSDGYTLVLNGAHELVYISADSRYHTRDESYLRILYDAYLDYWRVTSKDGTEYRFGNGDNARAAAIDGSGTRRWLLSGVTDTHGNQMAVLYLNDGVTGAVYPDTITYTYNVGLTTYRTVKFMYETRPDAVTSYRSGSPVTLDKQLAYIDVKMNGAMVRRYELAYMPSTNAQNALITAVQEFGSNAGAPGTGTSLPATQYGYATVPNDFSGGGTQPWLQQSAIKAAAGDFSGDGRADVAYCTSPTAWYIAKSTGSGFMVGGGVAGTTVYCKSQYRVGVRFQRRWEGGSGNTGHFGRGGYIRKRKRNRLLRRDDVERWGGTPSRVGVDQSVLRGSQC